VSEGIQAGAVSLKPSEGLTGEVLSFLEFPECLPLVLGRPTTGLPGGGGEVEIHGDDTGIEALAVEGEDQAEGEG